MKIIKNERGKHGALKLRVNDKAHLKSTKALCEWLKNDTVTIAINHGQVFLADDPEGDLSIGKPQVVYAAKLVRESFWTVYPDTKEKSTAYELDVSGKPEMHGGLMFYPLIRLDK